MPTVSVILEPATLQVGSGGVVTGVLHFAVEGVAIPGPGWNDLAVVVLGWWCEALYSAGEKHAVSLQFMDGPHQVRLLCGPAKQHPKVHRSRALWDIDGADRREVACQVVDATDRVLEFCERSSLESETATSLRRARDILVDRLARGMIESRAAKP